MSIWQDHKPGGASGDYLRLKDGDRKKVRFFSEPAVITYDGQKLRYQVVLYNKTDRLAQVYEFGAQVFGQIGELYDEWGEPTQFDITIGRTGSGMTDTSYSVTPSPKSEPLTAQEQEACEMIKFPSGKAKLLSAYEEDRIMPETIETKNNNGTTSNAELKSLDEVNEVQDEPINMEDIPF